MKWNILIGIELHSRIYSNKKIFSNNNFYYKNVSNNQISYLDLGLPGTLPTFVNENINKIVLFGIFFNFIISQISFFVRKSYFYPDVSKNYQISQFKDLILRNGNILIYNNYNNLSYYKIININHVHMEEDAASIIYDKFKKISKINFNRSGSFLLEIVSSFNLFDFYETFLYIKKLQDIFIYLNISNNNMEDGNCRFDVNISVKPFYSKVLNSKVEIKNLNSFFLLKKSINFEIKRQIYFYNFNKEIRQETRFYNINSSNTYFSRKKELFFSYKYFKDPDLNKIFFSLKFIKSFKYNFNKSTFFLENYYKKKNFFNYNFYNLILNKKLFFFFKKVIFKIKNNNFLVFNWIFNNIFLFLKKKNKNIFTISIDQIIIILNLLINKYISYENSKKIYFFILKKNIKYINIYKIFIFNKLFFNKRNKKIFFIINNNLFKNIKLLHYTFKKKTFNLLINKIINNNIKNDFFEINKILKKKII